MNTERVGRSEKAAFKLAELAAERGGRAYYVGGFVRDKLMGIENKDVDIEVIDLPILNTTQEIDGIVLSGTLNESSIFTLNEAA